MLVALLAFVLLAIPSLLSVFWVKVLTGAAIYSIVALGLGILMGRVGWCPSARSRSWRWARGSPRSCSSTPSLPFPIVLLLSGLITMVLGTFVGLPALRLSGLYLALITLMMAGAITVVLARPTSRTAARLPRPHGIVAQWRAPIRRPAIAETDPPTSATRSWSRR